MRASTFVLAFVAVVFACGGIALLIGGDDPETAQSSEEQRDTPAGLGLEPGRGMAERKEATDPPDAHVPSAPELVTRSPRALTVALSARVDEILATELSEVQEEWLPSRASLEYWLLDHRVAQIRDLPVARVRSFRGFEERWPEYALLLDGREGRLSDWIDPALRSELEDLHDAWYGTALDLWLTIGDADEAYPHWGFLVWVSERHFE